MPIEKRNGIYYARFQVNGQKVRRSLGKGITREEAKLRESELRRDATSHSSGSASGQSREFGEALLRYIEGYGVTGRSTLDHARQVRQHISDDTPLEEVPTKALEMRDALVARGLKPSTVNNHLAVVKRVLNLAYKEWDWIDRPLADRIKKLSTKGNARHVYLSREQVQLLVDSCENEDVKKVIRIAAYTGLRRGEILALTPQDYVEGSLIVRRSKSGYPRVVPVPPALADALDPFPSGVGRGLLQYHWEKARKRAGISCTFHDLRHTYASWLVANPAVPLGVVRDLMGHHDLAQTSRYSHLRVEALREAANTLE